MKSLLFKFSGWIALALCLAAFRCRAADASNLQSNTIQRLNEIKIPVVDFKDTPIEEVIKTLNDLSVKYSPDGKGILIYISTIAPTNILTIPSCFDKEMTLAAEGIMKTAYRVYDPNEDLIGKKVTLHLKNAPLVEILKHVTALNDTCFYVCTNGTVAIGYYELNLEARAYIYHNIAFDGFESPQIVDSRYQMVSPIRSLPKRKLLVIVQPAEKLDDFESQGKWGLVRLKQKPSEPTQ